MRKTPAVTSIAILTLALGIGATTTMFTIVDGVLLKPLHYHAPDRLVRVSGGATLARYEYIKNSKTLSSTGAFLIVLENAALGGGPTPDALHAARVTPNFLSVLGVSPALGRSFLEAEANPGTAVAMMSNELWRRRFQSDPNIVGKAVRIDAESCTIVGILPAEFAFPFPDTDIWRPLQPGIIPLQTRLHSPLLSVFGRLRDGVTLSQATAEMEAIKKQYAEANPGMLDGKLNRPEKAVLFHDQLTQNIRPTLWMLFGAVSCVLLIACANVASLLLARATSRSREFAIRTAIGASRTRIVTQLLAESLLLAIAGGALGVLFARYGLDAISALPGFELPRVGSIHMDLRVLLFASALSLLTTLLFGLTPAIGASKPDLVSVIKGVSNGMPGRLRVWRSPRGLLVIAQIALSTVLVIGAALLVQTLIRLRSVDLGFSTSNLLTMQLSLPTSRYPTPAKQAQFFNEFVHRVETLPGVRNAAATITLPTTGWAGTPVYPMGQALPKLNERPIAILQAVTPGYFRTLGIPLQRGRDFSERDGAESPLVVIINERTARRFWPAYPAGDDPVGKQILAGANPKPLEIIGVVGDIHQSGLADPVQEGIYRPRTQIPPMPAMVAVRTLGNPMGVAEAIRREVSAIDPSQTITAVRSMEEVVDRSEGQRRSIALLLAAFAGTGLLLSIVGVYGVIAYLVVQRTREVGIRRALGAQPQDILALILRQGLGLALLGAVAGLMAAAAFNQALRSIVFGVSTLDLLTYLLAAIAVSVLAVAASLLPARKAMRIEPAEALRMS